jgi:hypothetical protein
MLSLVLVRLSVVHGVFSLAPVSFRLRLAHIAVLLCMAASVPCMRVSVALCFLVLG